MADRNISLGILRYKLIKVLSCSSNVKVRKRRGHVSPHHDDHHVCVGREVVDESRELGVTHFHALELRLCLRAAQLELFDNVRDAFVTVTVVFIRAADTG